ncbi:hypothetical protein GmHk_10G028475 [Glycine max]|nr:hypothetical protein GmHk_10G028475 [Glycine max]
MSVVLRQTLLAALVQGRSSLCVDTIIAGDGKDMNEEFEETMKVSFQNSSSTYFTLKLKLMLCGFIKSSINFTETWCTAVDKGNYIDENMFGEKNTQTLKVPCEDKKGKWVWNDGKARGKGKYIWKSEADPTQTFMGYLTPTLGESNTIRPLDLSKGATFDFKHGFLQMLENNPFSGATLEDSMHNLKKLIKLSNIARQNHASVEYVRLYAFPFSLNRKAWDWLSSLPVNNISSWNQCKNTFSLP